jgi:hypothetical protein
MRDWQTGPAVYPNGSQPGADEWYWLRGDEWHVACIYGRYWVAPDEIGLWFPDFGLTAGPFDTLQEAQAVYLLLRGTSHA